MQRWIESPPASRDQLKAEATARAMKLFAPAGASAPVRRVDASTAAQAIGLLIQLQKDVDAAVQIVEQNINRFAGTDPVNRACTAQIRLALANRILALRFANSPNFAPLKPKAIAFIDEVLKLTADAESAQRQAVLRSKAHWILGELARTGVDPEKAKEENAKLLNQAREHYRQGIEAINLPDPDLAALSVRLNNVLGYAMSGANLRALTPKEQFRQIAVETDKYLTAIRPQVAGLLPTQVINGDAAANWIEKIDKLSTALKEAAKSP